MGKDVITDLEAMRAFGPATTRQGHMFQLIRQYEIKFGKRPDQFVVTPGFKYELQLEGVTRDRFAGIPIVITQPEEMHSRLAEHWAFDPFFIPTDSDPGGAA